MLNVTNARKLKKKNRLKTVHFILFSKDNYHSVIDLRK